MTNSRVAAAGVLVAAGILIPTLAPAGLVPFPFAPTPEPFVVKRFETGPRGFSSENFFPVGGPGGTDVRRDDFLRFTFSGALDRDSLNERTVRIVAGGESGAAPSEAPTPGAFSPDFERTFNWSSEAWELSRDHRRRVVFDPTGRDEWDFERRNPFGFAADTLYTVTLPGNDEGATETVTGRDGRPLARTFRTTFRTGSAYNFSSYDLPDFTSIEASDAPGVPLAGRTDVDPRASIVVHLSGPVLHSSFHPRLRIRNLHDPWGRPFRFRGRLSADGTTCEFRPRRPLPSGGRVVFFLSEVRFADRSGRYVPALDPVEFETANKIR